MIPEMDPVSIISVACGVSKVAYQVSVTLYTFVNATKNVDQSVNSLYAEVNGLNRVLDAIASSLENPVIKSVNAADQHTSELLNSIDGALKDCRHTVETLADILKGVTEKNKSRNPFKQSARQIKLNIREDEIKNLRSQTHTHNMNLQMALQTINL